MMVSKIRKIQAMLKKMRMRSLSPDLGPDFVPEDQR